MSHILGKVLLIDKIAKKRDIYCEYTVQHYRSTIDTPKGQK